jgi:biopolymer transport protein ExbB
VRVFTRSTATGHLGYQDQETRWRLRERRMHPNMRKAIVLLSLFVLTLVASSAVTPQQVAAQASRPMTEEATVPDPPDTTVSTQTQAPVQGGGHGDVPPTVVSTEKRSKIWMLLDWFNRGGPFMWPILLCSVVAATFFVERTITLLRARTNTRSLMNDTINAVRANPGAEGIAAAERVCEQRRGPIAAIIHSGLRQARRGPEAVEKAIETAGAVEMSFMERGLIWLATISTIAPLLGFLGTVSGMIGAFDAIKAADQVSAKLVAGGISEALITTQAGLLVAVPTSLFHNFFLSQIDRFVVEMEESSAELVNAISEL